MDEKDHASLLLAAVEPYACLQVAEQDMDAAVIRLDTEEPSLSPVIRALFDPLRKNGSDLDAPTAVHKGHRALVAAAPGIGVDLDVFWFHFNDVLQETRRMQEQA
jgi:hypothetical protein